MNAIAEKAGMRRRLQFHLSTPNKLLTNNDRKMFRFNVIISICMISV